MMQMYVKSILPIAALSLLLSPAAATVASATESVAVRDTAGTTAASASASEADILNKLHRINQHEIKLGRLAQKKLGKRAEATWPPEDKRVDDYAKMLVTDHMNLDAKVKEMANRDQVDLAETPKPKKQQKVENHVELLDNLKGNEFDAAFAKAMVNGHQKAIHQVQDYANTVQEADVKDLLQNQVLPVLKKHEQHAHKLRSYVGGAGGTGGGPRFVQ